MISACIAVSGVLVGSSAANAAWSGDAVRSTGAMSMVALNWSFTPIKAGSLLSTASGTGGSNYVSSSVGVSAGTTFVFDVTNNTVVSANPELTVTGNFSQTLSVLPTITITTCPTAFGALNSCTGGVTTLTTTWSLNNTAVVSLGNIAVGGTAHVAVSLGVALGNVGLAAQIDRAAMRAGMDRTQG